MPHGSHKDKCCPKVTIIEKEGEAGPPGPTGVPGPPITEETFVCIARPREIGVSGEVILIFARASNSSTAMVSLGAANFEGSLPEELLLSCTPPIPEAFLPLQNHIINLEGPRPITNWLQLSPSRPMANVTLQTDGSILISLVPGPLSLSFAQSLVLTYQTLVVPMLK